MMAEALISKSTLLDGLLRLLRLLRLLKLLKLLKLLSRSSPNRCNLNSRQVIYL
jgi:hypothetical protein